ncbi:hypothetical protein AA309_24965 [Microvirga vignae]|uniref:DUF6894 domain-containing protein n=1 Tax=Microvirga vignae TaxID=1225564 RepID=A0A0H1R6C3_9HYPH|nr:hypothetical protein AA309_24965 [Microvirga vignae]
MVNILAMPRYRFFVSNQQDRVRYPRSFDLADADVAKGVALQIARTFAEVVPYWDELSADQRNDFVVEIVDEADQTVLTVPFVGTK